MSDEELSLEEIMDSMDADPIEIKHRKVNKKLDEISDQLEFLQDQFPNE